MCCIIKTTTVPKRRSTGVGSQKNRGGRGNQATKFKKGLRGGRKEKSGESRKYMAPEVGGFVSPETQSWIQHTLFSNTSRSNTEVNLVPRALFPGFACAAGKASWGRNVGYRGSKRYSTMGIILFYVKGLLGLVPIKKKTAKKTSLSLFCMQTTNPMRSGNKWIRY